MTKRESAFFAQPCESKTESKIDMKKEPLNSLEIIMDYMQEEIKLRQKTYAMLKEKFPKLLENYNPK